MNSSRNLNYILGELRDEYPNLTLVKLTRLINQAYDDASMDITKDIQIKIDVVNGTRFYTIPLTDRPTSLISVHYKNSRDKYVPIPRHIGQSVLGESLT